MLVLILLLKGNKKTKKKNLNMKKKYHYKEYLFKKNSIQQMKNSNTEIVVIWQISP